MVQQRGDDKKKGTPDGGLPLLNPVFYATIFLMKETYFTPGNLKKEGVAIREELFPRGQKRARRFDPGKSALLVLDFQEYFLHPDSHAFIPSAPAVLPGLKELIDSFTAARRPVFYTQHGNTGQDAGSMASWWRDLLTNDHPFYRLHPELKPDPDDVIQKTQYDAFFDTDLNKRLQDQGVQQVVISGVMTHLCCETTARSAFVQGYEVFFLIDGTASYNRAFHLSSLRNLGHGFATLTMVEELVDKMAER